MKSEKEIRDMVEAYKEETETFHTEKLWKYLNENQHIAEVRTAHSEAMRKTFRNAQETLTTQGEATLIAELKGQAEATQKILHQLQQPQPSTRTPTEPHADTQRLTPQSNSAESAPEGEYSCADILDLEMNGGHKVTLACDRAQNHNHLHYTKHGIGPYNKHVLYEWDDNHPGRRTSHLF